MSSIVHGNKIAYYRFQRGLTLRELSQISGVDAVTINRAERGYSSPRPKTVQALCIALNVPINELFSVDDDFQSRAGV